MREFELVRIIMRNLLPWQLAAATQQLQRHAAFVSGMDKSFGLDPVATTTLPGLWRTLPIIAITDAAIKDHPPHPMSVAEYQLEE